MVDQGADETTPEAAESAPVGERPYLPFAAYPAPAIVAPPPLPTWTKAYEVPTARRVVGTGIQLVIDSTMAIRRASIYIGLLCLGALGPAVLLLLLGIGKLLSNPEIAETLAINPALVFDQQPDLFGPVALIYLLAIVGLILLVAISIDAQAIAVSTLGGRASDKPLQLWESINRARQVFWRLAGAGFLVGLASTIINLVVTLPFIRLDDANEGISFIGSMVGAIVVTPFAFVSASIVLGDVGAVEALRRSVTLFRARPRIALVVTLFTLVTAAVQSFAFGAGADAATRVAEVLHLSLDEGGLPLIVTIAIVLAFIVAFGSLTLTIAAIVSAPQVSGFLGLTYYSGGLDRARSVDGIRPRRFRWVSLPMAIAMVGLVVVAALGLPSITGFEPRPTVTILSFLRSAAESQGLDVSVFGYPSRVDDPIGEGGAASEAIADIESGEYGVLSEVPPWFLNGVFACGAPGVTCGTGGSRVSAFTSDRAFLFGQRMAAQPGATGGAWGPLLRVEGARYAPSRDGDRFPGASHAYITSGSGRDSRIWKYIWFTEGRFYELSTDARSVRIGDSLITIIPYRELRGLPLAWDLVACESSGTLGTDGCDYLRATPGEAMPGFDGWREFRFKARVQDPVAS